MGPASLYNAFGDKRSLFVRCLDRYLDGGMRERTKRLEESRPPREAIETFIEEVVRRSLRDRRGCLMVNSALEVGHDREIGAAVSRRLGELEAFFRRCVEAGRRDGSICPVGDAADVARLLLATVMGLRVLARARPERGLLEGAARQALALLGPPAGRA
jgi:TetR/AcrR family transcriptional repressor of nem operon